MGVLSLGLFLTACGTVTYNVVETDKKYEYEIRGMSGAKPDAGITIDGKMDDTAYRGLKTLTLKKNHEGQTAEIEVTTFIGKSGLYLGAQVEESTKVYYNPIRNLANNTCIEYYFGFGDGQARGSGIFEVVLSAGGQFSVRVMGKDGWENFGYKYKEAPIYAMQMAKADENGDCHAWSAEAFIPYEVFGRTARPATYILRWNTLRRRTMTAWQEPAITSPFIRRVTLTQRKWIPPRIRTFAGATGSSRRTSYLT